MGDPVTNSLPLARDGLLADYRPPAGVFDEMIAPAGSLRSPWEQFIGGVNRSGPQGLAQRAEQVKRLLRENGVTYNAVGAPQGPDRPWELDPLPLLFDQRSWQPLAEALIQRATLLNLILADVYGPQRLIHEGVLPPAVLFDQPGYLLPCHGIPVARSGVFVFVRGPFGATARRPMAGADRSHAGSFGHRLHAGKSHRRVAHFAARF